MLLPSALLSQIDYYHPPTSTNTPIDSLIWALILVAIFVIVSGAAHVARAREHRKLAEEVESSPH
jgi:hypothetical protein